MTRYERIKTMTLDELVTLLIEYKYECEATSDFSIYINLDECFNCSNWYENLYGDGEGGCINGVSCTNIRTFEDCVKAWLLKEGS